MSLLHFCLYTYTHTIRGQLTRVVSPLSLYVFQEWNLGLQAWWHGPLLVGKSHQSLWDHFLMTVIEKSDTESLRDSQISDWMHLQETDPAGCNKLEDSAWNLWGRLEPLRKMSPEHMRWAAQDQMWWRKGENATVSATLWSGYPATMCFPLNPTDFNDFSCAMYLFMFVS